MKSILLFDIDGTLLQVHTSFLKQLIAEQLHILGIDYSKVKNNRFAGRTDKEIFLNLIGERPGSDELFDELKRKYIAGMSEYLSTDNLTVFQEAAESVEKAIENGFRVGLCTGNFREVAEIKLEAAGLNRYFGFGGFGCDHRDRNYLPGQAYREYVNLFSEEPEPEQFVVIGDTPNDIRCAKFFGAKSVAVTTGHFSASELKKHEPDMLLDDLSTMNSRLHELYTQPL